MLEFSVGARPPLPDLRENLARFFTAPEESRAISESKDSRPKGPMGTGILATFKSMILKEFSGVSSPGVERPTVLIFP